MADTMQDRLRAAADKLTAAEAAKDAAARAKIEDARRLREREDQLRKIGNGIMLIINQQVMTQTAELAKIPSADRFGVVRQDPPEPHVIMGWVIQALRGGNNPRSVIASPELWVTLHKSGALIATWDGGYNMEETIIDQETPGKSVSDQIGELMVELYVRVADRAAAA